MFGSRLRFSAGLIPTLVTLFFLVLTVYLGTWQLSREREKLQHIEAHSQASDDVVLEITAQLGNPGAFMHRQIVATGRYDVEHQFLLDNRTHEGVAGYYVLSHFLLDDRIAIIVNRGWVALGNDRRQLPALPTPSQTVTIHGRLADAPRTFLLGDDGYSASQWPMVVQSVDYAKMANLLSYDLVPTTVQLDGASSDGFIRQWKAHAGITPQRHHAYAVQWFSLAATLLVLYLAFSLKRSNDE